MHKIHTIRRWLVFRFEWCKAKLMLKYQLASKLFLFFLQLMTCFDQVCIFACDSEQRHIIIYWSSLKRKIKTCINEWHS